MSVVTKQKTFYPHTLLEPPAPIEEMAVISIWCAILLLSLFLFVVGLKFFA